MKHSPRPRKTLQFSDSLHQRLNAYALAAGTAGGGMLAFSQPSQAKIVYTPVHIVLSRGSLALDLNNDGIVDFVLLDKYRRNGQTTNSFWLYVNPQQDGNAAVGKQGQYFRSASALSRGRLIGPKDKFDGNLMAFACSFASTTDCRVGNWFDVNNQYLGLKFTINGDIHYGWARLNVAFKLNKGLVATLTGYAYETVPNKPIIAGKRNGPGGKNEGVDPASLKMNTGEPATLGALALGAPGLSIWRRKDSLGAASE
jgi:hypothetical protein